MSSRARWRRPGAASRTTVTGLPRASPRPPAAWAAGLPGAGVVDRIEQRRFWSRLPIRLDDRRAWSLDRRGPWLMLSQICAGVTGRQVARRNLDVVTAICDDLGIDYLAVPEPNSLRFRLAIDDARWPDLVAGLRSLGQQEPVYVVVDAVNRAGQPVRWADLTATPRIAEALDRQTSLDVFRPTTPARGVAPFAQEWACVAERWRRDDAGRLRAPTRNARAEYVDESLVHRAMSAQTGRKLPTIGLFTARHVFDIDFPIDVVYLWVDGSDPAWRARKKAALEAAGGTWTEPDAIADARFRQIDELRYSLRSVSQFAPWVRHVYLVTDRQVPTWLDPTAPGLTVVDHRELFGDAGTLPTFNSHAIGARLHHIDGLAEHYLYVNDDVFLGRDVAPSLFFHSNEMSLFFTSRTSLGLSDAQHRMSHESARRNVADLLARDFGRTPTNVFFHSPIPQRRSTMTELEQRYPDEFERTWHNQFRSHSDIEPNSWLHNYYGYLTGRAVPGSIRYSYLQIGAPEAQRQLDRLFAVRDRDTFCLNDNPDATAQQLAHAADWLSRYFPQPSAFELDGHRGESTV